jgi:hypothetical protein
VENPTEEVAMKYVLLVHHGDTVTPNDPEAWEALPEEERQEITDTWQEISQTPGVTPGVRMSDPGAATTVRVENGKTLTTDGPFASVKEAVGGMLTLEADDLDAAIELATKVPSASKGGAVEIRPVLESW